MKKIGEGDKSEVFELEDGRILKLFVPHFADLAPVEAEVTRQLERAGVVLPCVDEMLEVDGRPGIVFRNLRAGKTISSEVRTKPWRIVPAAAVLAELHAAVHDCISVELPAQRLRVEEEIRGSDAVSESVRALALETLASLPDGNTVCHNDIHMQNVIVFSQGAMLIDWVLATRGNPLADVAGAVLQLRFGEQPRSLPAKAALELGRALFWRTYLRRYRQLRPVVGDELARWELPIAVALAGRRAGRMRRQLVRRIEQIAGRPQGARGSLRP